MPRSGHRPQVNVYHAVNLLPWGSGGRGDLLSGWCPELGIPVMVKRLRDHRPHARKAFEREIRIHSKDRPGCIRILFWNLDATPPWYAMPLMLGGTLTQWAGRLSPDNLHNVVTELARAVSGLHSDYIVHGDIKPHNILLGDDRRLNLATRLAAASVALFYSQSAAEERPAIGHPRWRVEVQSLRRRMSFRSARRQSSRDRDSPDRWTESRSRSQRICGLRGVAGGHSELLPVGSGVAA